MLAFQISAEKEYLILAYLFRHSILMRICVNDLDHEFFSNPYRRSLYEGLRAFFNTYNKLPVREHLEVSLQCLKYQPDHISICLGMFDQLLCYPCEDVDVAIDLIELWIKGVRLASTISIATKKVQNDDVQGAVDVLEATIRASFIKKNTIDNCLKMDGADIIKMYTEKKVNSLGFGIGVDALDKGNVILARGWLTFLMGRTGGGKSWAAISASKEATLIGKKVLFISLELDENMVKTRYFQSLTNAVNPKDSIEPNVIESVNVSSDINNPHFKDERVGTVYNLDLVNRQVANLNGMGSIFSVTHYPSGQATAGDVESAIVSFNTTFGVNPDLVIVDAVNNMRLGNDIKALREELRRASESLRAMAGKYDCGMLAMMQANRDADGLRFLSNKNVGESLGLVQTADVVMAIGCTKTDERNGNVYMNITKHRHDSGTQRFRMRQALGRGQFCTHSEVFVDDNTHTVTEDTVY